ncbi:exopolysaccharide biosynthesis polyprenyl glycosylphosphotransferase [candidate division LCP-89 bacterium B3_LCP]|uniref:Exopolysaccharide biosynthesis polyprenyl glycosylphosphotransferase n=1 Tax=candidate division LCP-89 bacterium B3_LCP TaxID=2012998 RepID=A0A532V5E1_UNCL8|nr:MAG: exopolysaccharide biosynthesis polyprenyl glycosylphosphotransferase [candidate division LCP-89 bacterium B3_LCP]
MRTVKISREKITLTTVDFIALNLAYLASYIFRYKTGLFSQVIAPEFRQLFIPSLIVSIGWMIVLLLRGNYRSLYGQSTVDVFLSVAKASLVGIFIIFLVTIDLHKPLSPSRVVLMSYWGFLILFTGGGRAIIRMVQRRLLARGIGLRNALIIGFNERAKAFLRQTQRVPDIGYNIRGFLNGTLEEEYLGVKVISDYDHLEDTVRNNHVHEVILVPAPDERELIPGIISRLANLHVGIKMLPDLTETLYGHVRTAHIRSVPLIQVFPDLLSPWQRWLKRISDTIVSASVLTFGSPLYLLIGLAIKINSKGPVLYRQQRVGRGGKEFILYKFRSMRQDAEARTGPVWAGKDDPRITSMGRIMRKLHIDEFPQFINVLKGDMALVGPRPERPKFVNDFKSKIPLYERRMNIKPGITGWAQVKHKYDESLTDVKDKLQYDLFYLENMSLALDLKIILSTLGIMFQYKGR